MDTRLGLFWSSFFGLPFLVFLLVEILAKNGAETIAGISAGQMFAAVSGPSCMTKKIGYDQEWPVVSVICSVYCSRPLDPVAKRDPKIKNILQLYSRVFLS